MVGGSHEPLFTATTMRAKRHHCTSHKLDRTLVPEVKRSLGLVAVQVKWENLRNISGPSTVSYHATGCAQPWWYSEQPGAQSGNQTVATSPYLLPPPSHEIFLLLASVSET